MLSRRIISAAVGIIYIILMLYIGGWFFKTSILLMALILMHEFYRALMNKGHKPVKPIGYLALLFLYISIILERDIYIMPIIGLTFIIGISLPVFFRSITIVDISMTFFAIIYPGAMILYLIPLSFKIQSYGYFFLLLTFVVTWATDTFAYFLGIKFGKKKLCPVISPKKTVEGSLGGLLGSIFAGIAMGLIFNNSYNRSIPFIHFIMMGAMGGIFSQIGDLAASSIKRYCGIKDFGRLLPGHGGLLDRFDSILFTAPLLYFYILLFINI